MEVILTNDCNICGNAFNRIAASADSNPMSWKDLSIDLEARIQRCGWAIYSCVHCCNDCIANMMLAGRNAVKKTPANAEVNCILDNTHALPWSQTNDQNDNCN